jgi:hypothetical protein
MKRDDRGLEPELEAFLTPRSIERHMPDELRARALARARAIVAAGGKIPATHLAELPKPLPRPVPRGQRLLRIALAASVLVALGAVGAVAAHYRSPRAPQLPLPAPPPPCPAVQNAPVPAPSEPPRTDAKHVVPAKPARPSRASAKDDAVEIELALLQRAHSAYTRHDFSGALALIAEHSRRFPNGHLAEQREALRVRSLGGSGRTEEAHRAAAAFATRFPRSVLLPHLEDELEARE